MHIDTNGPALARAIPLLAGLDYDLCVLTGDYRGRTCGPWSATMAGIERLRRYLGDPLYAVLGNHDTIHMVPALEALGIRVLINEAAALVRGEERIYLAGVDFPPEQEEVTAAVGRQGWAREHIVDNDTYALLRAGTDSPDAVAVVCGGR